jgi:hypothetical protein
MDSTEAIAYLNELHGAAASQTEKPSTSEGPEESTGGAPGEQKEIDTPVPPESAKDDREPPKANEDETTVADEPKPEQKPQQTKKPNKQERINHAFQREKQRHKAEIEVRDKRIAELEANLKKYAALEQRDFDPNDVKGYIDHRFALNGEQAELDRLKQERESLVADERAREAQERHEQLVNECYQSDDEKEHYWNLLRNGGQKFREFLNDYDDGTIDAYIGESRIAPVLISTLMRNPDILRGIVEKRNPTIKMMALQQLENRLNIARMVGTRQTSQGTPQQAPKAKPKLPILGSQVANPGSSGESGKHDWNRFLQEHPRGTGR